MGFVVYSKKDGELLRYYSVESKAQAQVTGHNRKAVIEALKGDEYVTEWDLCKWDEYEKIFKEHYTADKYYYLSKSNY